MVRSMMLVRVLDNWLTAVATVTSDEIQNAGKPFVRGYSDGSDGEELVLDIARILLSSDMINETDADKHKTVAEVVKILTTSRSVGEAREYLRSEKGAVWRKS